MQVQIASSSLEESARNLLITVRGEATPGVHSECPPRRAAGRSYPHDDQKQRRCNKQCRICDRQTKHCRAKKSRTPKRREDAEQLRHPAEAPLHGRRVITESSR